MKQLTGVMFVWNGIAQDYNFRETINCLLDLCDEISVVYGGTDGTEQAVEDTVMSHPSGKPAFLTTIDQDVWDAYPGREKLAHFTNEAIRRCRTEWFISVQADEVIYDRSFDNIRAAINTDNGADSWVFARYNVWRDPLSMLNVVQERKPCSTEVIRLAKRGLWAYGDAEHIAGHTTQMFGDYQAIEMYHAGFIRDPIKMVTKARNMLVDIFGLPWDERIGDKFDYRNFPFTDQDIIPVPLPLPSYLIDWLRERHPSCNIPS